jgi:hypothetical protein
LGIQADDLAGFPCGNLRLAQQKGQVHALLPERGAVRGFFKGGIDQGAGFLEATGFKEFVSSSRLGVTGAGAGGKKEQRQKEKDESSYHSFTFTFTFTKKKEGTELGRPLAMQVAATFIKSGLPI